MIRIKYGRYAGKTFQQLFFLDPGYVEWMMRKSITKSHKWFIDAEIAQIRELIGRATNLKIPGKCDHCDAPVTRMIVIDQPGERGGLAAVQFLCATCARYSDGGSRYHVVRPGFLHAERFKNYDKTGGKILVRAIKFRYFGNGSRRVTAELADEFFDNPENFILPESEKG